MIVCTAFLTFVLSACDNSGGKLPVVCGDGTCSEDETDSGCSADCGCQFACGEDVAPYGCYCDSLCADKGDCCADVDSCEQPAAPAVVIPVYLTATDTPPEDVAKIAAFYEQMFSWVQTWYMLEMKDHGYKTFQVEPVRVFPSQYTRAEWDNFSVTCFPGQNDCDGKGSCSMFAAAWFLLPEHLAAAGLPPVGSEGVLYYAIGGAGMNGSCAGGGVAASEEVIVTRTMADCPNGSYAEGGTDCGMLGVIAHEQGHAFGLPHASDRPEGCTGGPSVMDVWWDYDRGATLCEEDRVQLETSGYFR